MSAIFTLFLMRLAITIFYETQWGTWKSGVSLLHTGIRHPSSVMKNVIPIVMAGGECLLVILQFIMFRPYTKDIIQPLMLIYLFVGTVIGIYGLIIAVILAESISTPNKSRENMYSIYTGMAHVSEETCV